MIKASENNALAVIGKKRYIRGHAAMRSMSLIRFYTIGQQAYQVVSSSLSSDNRITERRRHGLPPKEGMEHAADTKAVWLHKSALEGLLEKHQAEDRQHVWDVLDKARSLSGLSLEDVAGLMAVHSQDLLDELFHTAKSVKEEIYGNRIVLFAPLYISNLCSNECLYCAFRRSNKEAIRRALNPDEIWQETKILLRQGHKRVLMVAGEAYPGSGIDYVLEFIDAIYGAEENGSRIRRVNVNLAPLSVEDFRRLKERNIGTFQLFQETYHRPTYGRVHLAGPKKDLDWRASYSTVPCRRASTTWAWGCSTGYMTSGSRRWSSWPTSRILRSGLGSAVIPSACRIEPAIGSDLASRPPYTLNDQNFLKLVAILRLAVPYTGIIMSTREKPAIRQRTLELGVSQISAGSRTNPGGYQESSQFEAAQFQLGDHRSLAEVIADLGQHKFIPSFCTGCYRLGRTGNDFMGLAKPGLIKEKCAPNALSTFEEYLLDYGTHEAREAGERAIAAALDGMDGRIRKVSENLLAKVRDGHRDVCC